MFHVLVWDQNVCHNSYLTQVYHMVCCVSLETLVLENGLWHNTFSFPDAQQLYYFVHNTPCLSTFFTWPFFVLYVIYKTMFAWFIWQVFFVIPVLSSRQYLCCCVHYHFSIKPFPTRDFDIGHQMNYQTFVCKNSGHLQILFHFLVHWSHNQ